MQIEEREIGADQVRLGMFVCRLDRPWTDTPFPLQGFHVREPSELDTLRRLCNRVWIDVELSERSQDNGLRFRAGAPSTPRIRSSAPTSAPVARRQAHPAAALDPRIGAEHYDDTVDFELEIPAAREALDVAASTISGLVDQANGNRPITPEAAHAAARPIVASMLRNADALFWLNSLRRRDTYAYSHALNCAAFAAAFGRHLGLPQDFLVELAMGAMLMDVGKTQVPDALLRHPGPLDPLAMARIRRHVEFGTQALSGGEFSDVVRDMVQGHHERADGTGYPAKRSGPEIPLHVRIAAIVDSFDAMTSQRPHAPAMSRHVALQALYRDRATRYYPELVEQFISCMGIYPTGSLAELNTGEIVAVMAQNVARRLRPRVLVLTSPQGELLQTFRSIDLLSASPELELRRPLPDRHAGIDIAELYL